MRPLLLFVGSALLRGLAQPGWLAWPLILLAAPLRILCWRIPLRRAWAWDLAHGFVFWLFAFSFLAAISPLAALAAALVMAPLGLIEGWLARRLLRWLPLPAAGALALAGTAWLQMEWFLLGVGGVPWASWAWPLADSPLLPLVSALGESGLIALVLAFAAALVALGLRRARDPVLLAAPALLLYGLLARTPVPSAAETLSCLAVQGCIRVQDKALGQVVAGSMFRRQVEVTRAAFARGEAPRLVLWAETMFPYPVVDSGLPPGLIRQWFPEPWLYEEAPSEAVADAQQRAVKQVLAGAPEGTLFATGVHLHQPLAAEAPLTALSPRSSSTVIFDAHGAVLGRLGKSELVPFGERLPLGGRFPGARWLAEQVQRGSGLRPDFLRPSNGGPLRVAGLPALGFATCWENVFPAVFRRQADRGARAFVLLSNEDWYGDDSREMDQMIAASRLRAVETRRPVLRVTNTGRTALIGADGSILDGPAVGQPAAWSVDLPLVDPALRTFHQRLGYAILPVLAALAAVLALAPQRKAAIDRLRGAG